MADDGDDSDSVAPNAFTLAVERFTKQSGFLRALEEATARAAKSLPFRLDRLRRFKRLEEDRPRQAAIMRRLSVRDAFVLLEDKPLPKGRKSGTAALDAEMESALAEAQARNEPLTTAAKRVLSNRGVSKRQLKSRADYAVRLFRLK